MVDRNKLFQKAAALGNQGDFEGAIECYTAILGAHSSDTEVLDSYGQTLLMLGRTDEAITAFQASLTLEPNSAITWLSLGHAYSATGDATRSIRSLYRCLSLDLDHAAESRGLVDFLSGFIGAGNYLSELDPQTLETTHRGLFIITLPKSGTVFLQNALCRGLSKRPASVPSGGVFPNVTIPQSAIEYTLGTGSVYLLHCAPSEYNKIEISHKLDRLVIQIRDPRQALLSWAYFITQVVQSVDPVLRYHFGLPNDYEGRKFEAQIDWLIEHHLPDFINFIAGWLEISENPEFQTEVLFLTHESLADNQGAYFSRLLSFYEIPEKAFVFPEEPKHGSLNFRQGKTDEWRHIFSVKQAERATALIPERLFDKFGWVQ